ncbi:hypothetical protein HN51_004520, partial [Arachis hypogaea]
MIKGGIFFNIVSFNVIIDTACKINNLGLSLKLLKRMTMMLENFVWSNSITYNCIINGFCNNEKLLLVDKMHHKMVKATKEP